jgi:hypothetical protein
LGGNARACDYSPDGNYIAVGMGGRTGGESKSSSENCVDGEFYDDDVDVDDDGNNNNNNDDDDDDDDESNVYDDYNYCYVSQSPHLTIISHEIHR